MSYTGMLKAADARDSLRVELTVDGGVLHATEPSGAAWDIALDRVQVIRWSEREVQLELAGNTVLFVPDDPDAALGSLLPLLVATSDRSLPATTGGPPDRHQPPAELVVDLSEPATEPRAPAPSGQPAAPWPDQPHTMLSAPARRRREGLALAIVLVVAGLVAGVAVLLSLGSGAGPAERAREALDDAGLTAVAVAVDGQTATLTGTVSAPDEAEQAAALLTSVDGIDGVVNRLEMAAPGAPTTAGPATNQPPALAAEAGEALAAIGIDSAVVEADGSRVVVTGTVGSEAVRRTALAALFAVDGVEEIDNRLEVTPVPDETATTTARAALDQEGFEAVTVTIDDGIATLTGVVPLAALDDGFFQYADRAEDIVTAQSGVRGVRNRLQLTGDAATLRDQLRSLTASAPITFGLGDSALTAAGRVTLDGAAEIIQAQPGLRVLIAGHTDTTGSAAFNEQLSQERADAVRQYLVEQGIAANRLVVVAYGELFPSSPGAAPLDRRVEFEVAG